MSANDMLRNPLAKKKPLTKAPRDEHPAERLPATTPTQPSAPAAAAPAVASTNRVGPNRVRKSFYLPADTAEELTQAASRIHHASGGRVSKAEAAGALIQFGLRNLPEVHKHLQV